MASPEVHGAGARRAEATPEEEARAEAAPVVGVGHAEVTQEDEVVLAEVEVGNAAVFRELG